MFTKKTKKAGKKSGKPFGGKGAAPFAKKGGKAPMPMLEDDTALDAKIGQSFRGGNPGGGKSLPSRPPWA